MQSYLLACIVEIIREKRIHNQMPLIAHEMELKRRLLDDMDRALEALVEEHLLLRYKTLNSFAYELPNFSINPQNEH